MVHCARCALPCDSPTRALRAHAFHSHVGFITEHPEYVARNNAMGFLSDNGGADYNLCHCTSFFPSKNLSLERSDFLSLLLWGHGCEIVWSNFEIADLDFWRGEAYTAFFEYLDQSGGFYYEVL